MCRNRYALDSSNNRVHVTNDARVAFFDRHISQNPLKTGRHKRVLEIGSGRNSAFQNPRISLLRKVYGEGGRIEKVSVGT